MNLNLRFLKTTSVLLSIFLGALSSNTIYADNSHSQIQFYPKLFNLIFLQKEYAFRTNPIHLNIDYGVGIFELKMSENHAKFHLNVEKSSIDKIKLLFSFQFVSDDVNLRNLAKNIPVPEVVKGHQSIRFPDGNVQTIEFPKIQYISKKAFVDHEILIHEKFNSWIKTKTDSLNERLNPKFNFIFFDQFLPNLLSERLHWFSQRVKDELLDFIATATYQEVQEQNLDFVISPNFNQLIIENDQLMIRKISSTIKSHLIQNLPTLLNLIDEDIQSIEGFTDQNF